MRKGLVTLFIFLTFLTIGCSSIKNENAIYATYSYEKEVIEAKAQSVENMIKEKMSFSLLMYTEQCNYCQKAKENLNQVIKDFGFTFYQIEMYNSSIDYLNEKLPDYYSKNDSYPFLYIINRGEISYKSKVEDLTNISNFKKMVKSYSKQTSMTTITKIESYNDYKTKSKDYVIYCFDSSRLDGNKTFDSYIYEAASKSKKNILIIDKMTAKSELISQIYKDYSLTENDTFDILSSSIDGQIKTTLRYLSESGSNISEFVKSYF